MNTQSGTYQQQLLLALRLHDVPGPRIAEALAEVDSHVTETGEDPYRAFGPPKDYAAQLAEVLGGNRDGGWLGLFRSMTWRDAMVGVVSLTGAGLLSQGVLGLGSGQDGPLGLPPLAPVAAGLILLAGLGAWFWFHLRDDADRVFDPRTGRDMARPAMPWAVAVAVISLPCALLLAAYLVSVAV